MNKKKRNRNRANAAAVRLASHVCPECCMRGERHWVQWSPPTLADILSNVPPSGFWICPKFYDAETGRRIDQ